MKRLLLMPLILFPFFSFTHSQTIIGEGLSGQDLWDYVIDNYKTTSTLGYTACRDICTSSNDMGHAWLNLI